MGHLTSEKDVMTLAETTTIFFYEQTKGGETRNTDNQEEIVNTELGLRLHYIHICV